MSKNEGTNFDLNTKSDLDIKEQYAKWLQGLEVEPTFKAKKQRKRTSKRSASLTHLIQPTESSSQKNVSIETSRTSSATVQSTAIDQDEAQRRRFQILVDEASFVHFTYEIPWIPGIGFFSLLARQAQALTESRKATLGCRRANLPNFPVHVPPTVMREYGRFHPGECSILFFFTVEQSDNLGNSEPSVSRNGIKSVSSKTLYVLQFHFFETQAEYLNRLPWIQRLVASTQPHSIILSLLKTGTFKGPSDLQPLTNEQEIETTLRSLWKDQANTIDIQAVQQYVGCKGCSPLSGKTNAWIARTVYRKRDRSASIVWILTGNNPNWASTSWSAEDCTGSPPCQIVKCTNARSWITPRLITEAVAQFLDATLRSSFAELVLDLVQGHNEQWYLLQVKAFQLHRLPQLLNPRVKSAPDRLETTSISSFSLSKLSKWKCMGRYCSDSSFDTNALVPHSNSLDENPAGFLTKKELLTCDFYARAQTMEEMSLWNGTVGGFAAALAFYLQHEIRPRDRAILYHSQPLCSVCLQRYHHLRAGYTREMTNQDDDVGNSAILKSSKTRVGKTKSLKALSIVPRTLPALELQSESKHIGILPLSASMPALDSTVQVTSNDCVAPPLQVNENPKRSYLDDLDCIERILGQDESQDKAKALKHDPLATLSWMSSNVERNIDAMWESVRLKPVTVLDLKDSRFSLNHLQYNSFSLCQALNENASSNFGPEQKPPHTISIVNSHKVVVDDTFRNSLVQDALQHLLHNSSVQGVQFVVLPPVNDDADTKMVSTSHEALGRAALSALFFELATTLQLTDSSKYMPSTPPISSDPASGCLNMICQVSPKIGIPQC